ncbi:LOW QUALITY PROTEIN: hypothetical protein V2J09_010287 [Rumex salicifolius]
MIPVYPFKDMGIKLQTSISYQQRGFLSMERTFKQHGVQAVKMTMLKQEEIFKQQVKELHRLYNLQRMLMEEVKKEMTRQSKYSSSNGWERSGSCSGGESETRFNAKRSLGFDSDIIRVRGGDDHQEADSIGMSITMGPSSTIMAGSSRIMGASHTGLQEELCGLDLTLRIGGGDKKRLKELQDSSGGLEKL